MIEQMKKTNETYSIERTGSSLAIKTRRGKYVQPAMYIGKQYMHLFRQLKDEVQSRADNFNLFKINYSQIAYFKNAAAGEAIDFPAVFQVDLSGAYISSAEVGGYISKDFAEKLRKLPKNIRLVLMGSLATNKIVETWQGDKCLKIEEKGDEFFISVWKNICYNIAEIMQEAANIFPGFIFYWVDGIYFDAHKKATAAELIDFFDSNGFPAHSVPIEKIILRPRFIKVYEDANNFKPFYI